MPTKSPAPQKQFSWIGQYGWLLGLILAGYALYTSTPLMTGQLSNYHAGLEKSCGACHGSSGTVADEACLKCHSEIRTKDSSATIHLKVKQKCTVCHQEHRSRNYPVRLGDTLSFNHDKTGFSLKKYHPAVDCNACHSSGKPYYDVKKRCADCHLKWDRSTFDHEKVTKISIKKHSSTACTDCHPGLQYEPPPTCTPCHDRSRNYQPGVPL